MAITLVGSPTFSTNPCYNPIEYYFNSTNKEENGFRYLVTILDEDDNILIPEKKLIPGFGNGYGVLKTNRELSDFLTYDFDLDNLNTNEYDASNSYLKYKIDVGEEYFVTWEFEEYGFESGATGTTWDNYNSPLFNPVGGNKTFLYNTNVLDVPPFENGDTIYVNLNPGTQSKPEIGGFHKVLDVFNYAGLSDVYWGVILDRKWVGSGISTGGNIKYADNRKSRFESLLTVDNQNVINTVLPVKDWVNYNVNDYKLLYDSVDCKFLSNIYTGYKVRLDNYMFIQYLTDTQFPEGSATYIQFENNLGDITKIELDGENAAIIRAIDVSPSRTFWGDVISGSSSIVYDSVDSYSFQLLNVDENPISEKIELVIDRECPSIDSLSLVYMDKYGSFLTWNFKGRCFENHTIERVTSEKFLGGFDATLARYNYSLLDGGDVIHNSSYIRSFILNTDFLTGVEAEFFENVVHSPVTFLMLESELQRCIITDNTFSKKKDGWFEAKRYTLNVQLSNRENINI